MLDQTLLTLLEPVAKGIAMQFGTNCEVVIHDVNDTCMNASVIDNKNGQIISHQTNDDSSNTMGDVFCEDQNKPKEYASYITKRTDGRILKSTTVYLRDAKKKIIGSFSIHYDITSLMLIKNALNPLTSVPCSENNLSHTPLHVNDLLTRLIEESVQKSGKPAACMTREDKIEAIKFLDTRGALLITKAGDKISKYFGISKYTLYSYLDSDD